jgi:tetratricopeptide (TPR) repeat protein
MRKKYLFVMGIILLLCLDGCKSNPLLKANRTEMYVMVYDYENTGLQGVSLYIDGKEQGSTDVRGRFLLDFKEKKSHVIRVVKNGYEEMEREFVYDPLYVLYFQMGNAPQYLQLAEDQVDKGFYENALDFLERSLSLEPARIDALYLKAIIYYKMGRTADAEAILSSLKSHVRDAEYVNRLIEKLKIETEGTNGNTSSL